MTQYPLMNSTLAGQNVMYPFIYANQITNGFFMFFVVLAFFFVVLFGSMISQQKFKGRIKAEFSFLAASFSTLGFATIMEAMAGLLNPTYFIALIGLTIASFVWNALTPD
jgi:hypothetical protein